jgi:hypothetical protein
MRCINGLATSLSAGLITVESKISKVYTWLKGVFSHRLVAFSRAVISRQLIAGGPRMSGERRRHHEDKSAPTTNLSIVFVVVLAALGVSVTLLSARYDLWTPAQLDVTP